MILLSHAATNSSVGHTARALRRAGVLSEFWTYWRGPNGVVLRNLVSAVLDATYGSDAAPANPAAAIDTPDPLSDYGVPESPPSHVFARALDREMTERIERELFQGVYAFQQGAESSFRAAGRRGLLRIYDLQRTDWLGHHPVLDDEAVREPEWASTLDLSRGSPDLRKRAESELRQADLVLVGSTFGLDVVEQAGELPGTTAVLPPAISVPPAVPPGAIVETLERDKLRVLFAGDLGQRAGLSYLFRAWRTIESSVALTVIGRPPGVWCRPLQRELRAVRWLPGCTPEEIRREMAEHHVFVYPSIFDHGSHVVLQALAMGLPVVASDHSAAPDIITDGVEGFIVPARSVERLVESLECLRRDPERRAGMAQEARRRASAHNWETYERTLATIVATALGRR